MDYTNFEQVLLWIVGIGAPSIVAYVLAWVVENVKGWASLPRDLKFIIPMVVSVLLSIGAAELLKYPEVVASVQPWFQVVMSSVLAYLASQKSYITAMNAQYGRRFSALRAKKLSQ